MILFFLFIGLWLGFAVRQNWIVLTIVAILLFIFIWIRFQKKCAIFFLCSVLIATGLSFIRIDQDKTQYQGMVVESKENYYILSSGLEKLYISNVNNQYEVGDILKVYGKKEELDFKILESSFDFKQHLNNKGIYYEFVIKSYKFINKTPIRLNKYKKYFLSKFDADTKDFVGSLYFGSGYANELSDTLRALHLYRLATLSGLSIYVILHGLTYLLSLKLDEKKANKIALILLCPYLLFSIGKFAIFKMISLCLFKWINERFLKEKLDYMSMVSLFGIACLIVNHNLALQDSFNLSFLMTILFTFYNNSFRYLKPKKKQFFSLILITLFFVPFETNFYHEISLFGPFFQSIFSPIIVLISISTMLCFYGIPIYHFVDILVRGFSIIIHFIKPGFITIYCAPMPLWFSLIYESILLTSTYLFAIRFKPLYKIPPIFALIFGLYFAPLNNNFSTYISFLNIGQGDSTHIHVKGLDILIDTGGNLYKDIAKEVLIPYFKKKKIYAIDYLITTHDDFDHMGARDSLMANFRVKNYLREPEQFPLKVGDFVMNNLNIYIHDSPEENENSLVLQFSLKDCDILVMGDAPIIIEKYILNDYPNLKCDILKVGHHGSNTSSSYKFVETLDPDVAIISCGKHNKYGHPHDEVLSVLNRLNVEIRRTDIESTITYYF